MEGQDIGMNHPDYIWLVFIASDGAVLGTSVPFGTKARVGYAKKTASGWKRYEAEVNDVAAN